MTAPVQTIEWIDTGPGYLRLLDQTRLPKEVAYLDCHTAEDVWHAIRQLSVRGAPAIGIAAAYGVCLGVQNGQQLEEICAYLATSRPTAVNLFWALERMRRVTARFVFDPDRAAPTELSKTSAMLLERLLAEARAIHDEDRAQCAAIGQHGARLLSELPQSAGILTHCNTGALATGGDGTALAVIFALAAAGQTVHVYADETRPLLQGARLTAWELLERNIPATLICDSMAAQVMRQGRVQAVITGADRIAANGDTANKIGTYSLAVLARAHGLPFYVAAPTTTFDLTTAAGDAIPIEERAAQEITNGFGTPTAPEGIGVYNPAFDVTPAELITAIITERGVIQPVDAAEISAICSADSVSA